MTGTLSTLITEEIFLLIDLRYPGLKTIGVLQGRAHPPPPDDLRFSNTTGILKKRKTMWFIGVEVEQETKSWIRPCVTFCLSNNKAKTPVNTRIRERGIGVQSWLCDKMWASLPADFALIIGKI